MELGQAIELIRHAKLSSPGPTVWADLGCGSGLFTVALSRLLRPKSKVYAIDINIDALKKLKMTEDVAIEKLQYDFVRDELPLHDLDGILMANSLHYVQDKKMFIQKIEHYLNADGCFLIVEYNTDSPNRWVPYPLSYSSLKLLFEKTKYSSIEKIFELPSVFNRAKIYSVVVCKNAL